MLKNVRSISDKSPSEVIEDNLIRYFDYGFLNIGSYINIDYSTDLNSSSILTKMTDQRFSGEEVWQGNENWIFEQDIQDDNTNVPAVYNNGVLVSDPKIDYENGRVFLPTGATNVRAEYSYKWCLFTSTRNSLSFLRFDNTPNNNQTPAEKIIPLPVVTFHVPSITDNKFYAIGGRKLMIHKIKCEVFAKNNGDAKKIADIIANQAGYTIPLYCLNDVIKNDNVPLNFNGTLNSGKNHTQLFESYPWTEMKIESIKTKYDDYISNKLHKIILDIETRTIFCGVC